MRSSQEVDSAAEVTLAQDFEPVVGHEHIAYLDVLDVQDQTGPAIGMDEERIGKVDVRLPGAEGHEAGGQVAGTFFELNNNDVTDAKRHSLFNKKGLYGVGVSNNETDHGHVDAVLHAEAHDVDMGLTEKLHDSEQRPRAVGKEDGKLADKFFVLGGIGIHDW